MNDETHQTAADSPGQSGGAGARPASKSGIAGWGPGRWGIVAVAVLLLVVYPAARWLLSRSSTPAAEPAAPAQNPGEAALQQALQHYQAKRYDEAVTAAKAAIEANPTSANAFNTLAVSYMGLGRADDAIQAVQAAIRLDPNFQLAKNNLAWFQQEKAKAAATPVPPANVQQADALINQSLQHSQAKRYKECADTATQAIKLNPGSAAAFNNLGFCQANLKQWDDAIRSTQEAIRLDPGLQMAKNNLVWMQQERQKAGGVTK